MAQLTEKERIEILMMIGFGDRVRTHEEVCHLFNAVHPDRNPISRSAVSKTLKRYTLFGSVKNLSKSGRPKTATNENISLDIAAELQENPRTSTTSLSLSYNVSRRSVSRILKKEKYFPYKVQLVQELSEDDFDRRMDFCERLMDICNNDRNFIQNLIFSDEATFYLNGMVNRHNCRYWSTENPRWVEEAHTQYPEKLNVWAGIFNNRVIGPFFIDGSLTGQKYLDLLQNDIIPAIMINGQVPLNVWFQQDGAPPHYDRNVRNFLNLTFTNRWIGRRGSIEWPARSPDLSPLDFYFWGYLKNSVYSSRPNNLHELQQRIITTALAINVETFSNVSQEFLNRLAYCLEVNGQHFEHLIN